MSELEVAEAIDLLPDEVKDGKKVCLGRRVMSLREVAEGVRAGDEDALAVARIIAGAAQRRGIPVREFVLRRR